MFALLSHLLGKLVSSDDVPSHNAYLAYGTSFCSAISRDQNAFASDH
ncbi:hypothetical protein [Caballeronia insecticola]|uniref:Uncharacterized protein n=1 Tax=Caballeronia insecticola TaxID=758793 RepID=R4WYB2_9BURK|nr:hypothetical protein [Caballeronia insecticola]BAN26410.1 hypothetical protein BRPE64_CCDS03270 [Caballeronia insecticola]